MKLLTIFAKGISIVAVGLAGLIVLAGIVLEKTESYHVFSVQSTSMKPALMPGDLVIVRPVAMTSLKPGDMVSYHSLQNTAVIITHRILRINQARHIVMTKGDAVAPADEPFSDSLIVGRVTNHVARAGHLLSFLRSPQGVVLACYVPALLITVQELRRLVQYYDQSTYRLLRVPDDIAR